MYFVVRKQNSSIVILSKGGGTLPRELTRMVRQSSNKRGEKGPSTIKKWLPRSHKVARRGPSRDLIGDSDVLIMSHTDEHPKFTLPKAMRKKCRS